MGNIHRIDPQTMQAYLSDVSTKRRIRNYVRTFGAVMPAGSMKKLLETMYITTPDSYAFLRNDNICIAVDISDFWIYNKIQFNN